MSPPAGATTPPGFAVGSALPIWLVVARFYDRWIFTNRLWGDILEAREHPRNTNREVVAEAILSKMARIIVGT